MQPFGTSMSLLPGVEQLIEVLERWESTDSLNIDSGETQTTDSGDEDTFTTVSNAGTYDNGGTVQTTGATPWTLDDPVIRQWWDVPQSQRGPGADQPAELYVLQTVDTDITPYSADNELNNEFETLEVWVYTLFEDETMQYQRDVIQILTEYLDSNQSDNFYRLEPTNARDLRAEKNARNSDYYVATVELSLRTLTDTGVA